MKKWKRKWRVSSGFLIANEDGKIIATVQPVAVESLSVSVSEAMDNAALLAKAPEAFAACEAIAKMPCISELLGEAPLDDWCGCASCVAKTVVNMED